VIMPFGFQMLASMQQLYSQVHPQSPSLYLCASFHRKLSFISPHLVRDCYKCRQFSCCVFVAWWEVW